MRKNSATAGLNIGPLNKKSDTLSTDIAITCMMDVVSSGQYSCNLHNPTHSSAGCIGEWWFFRTNYLCLRILLLLDSNVGPLNKKSNLLSADPARKFRAVCSMCDGDLVFSHIHAIFITLYTLVQGAWGCCGFCGQILYVLVSLILNLKRKPSNRAVF